MQRGGAPAIGAPPSSACLFARPCRPCARPRRRRPEGVWQSGPIHLKSNLDLHVARGATLLFSEKPQDYLPAVPTRWEGMECHDYPPRVYACDNVTITAGVTLRARLDIWKRWYARPSARIRACSCIFVFYT